MLRPCFAALRIDTGDNDADITVSVFTDGLLVAAIVVLGPVL
jgi:hypothetical protein